MPHYSWKWPEYVQRRAVILLRALCLWDSDVDVWMARWRVVTQRDELRCGTLLLAKVSSRVRFQLLSQKQPWTNLVTLLKSNKTICFFTKRLKSTTVERNLDCKTFADCFGVMQIFEWIIIITKKTDNVLRIRWFCRKTNVLTFYATGLKMFLINFFKPVISFVIQ